MKKRSKHMVLKVDGRILGRNARMAVLRNGEPVPTKRGPNRSVIPDSRPCQSPRVCDEIIRQVNGGTR